jgi:CDP-diacylglycerol pyrophosphatase
MHLTCISTKIREDYNKNIANITKVWLNSTVILNQKRQMDVFFL